MKLKKLSEQITECVGMIFEQSKQCLQNIDGDFILNRRNNIVRYQKAHISAEIIAQGIR
jgi:hypothetical protein